MLNISLMGAALLITLREGLEISLVLAIIFGYLDHRGGTQLRRQVWIGTAAAAAVCVVAGTAFYLVIGDFEGKTEEVIEGVLAFSAVLVLTWMIFWMRSNAAGLRGDLQNKIDSALGGSPTALMIIAFVAVAREGFETVLFLVGAETDTSSGTEVIIGGLIGLAIAAGLGLLIYQGSHRVDIKSFFKWTGTLLILFAAGLFAKGVHEFRAFLEIDTSFIADRVWTITSGPWAKGETLHDFMKGLFGWSPNPERVRVVAYFAYLVPVLWYYFVPRSSTRPDVSTVEPDAEAVEVSS